MKPSQSNAWKKVEGWCTNAEGDYLYSVSHSLPPNGIFVDLGTYHGKSAIAMALGCKDGAGARVLSVDHFLGNTEHRKSGRVPSLARAHTNILALGVNEYITVVATDCVSFAHQLNKTVHAVFIDTEHKRQDVIDTFAAWWAHLGSKGHVLFHDSHNSGWTEVIEAVDDIVVRWPMEYVATVESIRHYRKMV